MIRFHFKGFIKFHEGMLITKIIYLYLYVFIVVLQAYLTLQFVESLIQKNCVDLLGGSSNVMLDLMGCLLNDIKKMSASDRSVVQWCDYSNSNSLCIYILFLFQSKTIWFQSQISLNKLNSSLCVIKRIKIKQVTHSHTTERE